MNLKEAMHAMIDGKRVKQKHWSDKTYCYYNVQSRAFYFSGVYFDKRAESCLDEEKDWEIVPQKVLKKFEWWLNIDLNGNPIVYVKKESADAFQAEDRLGEAEHIVIERWVEE